MPHAVMPSLTAEVRNIFSTRLPISAFPTLLQWTSIHTHTHGAQKGVCQPRLLNRKVLPSLPLIASRVKGLNPKTHFLQNSTAVIPTIVLFTWHLLTHHNYALTAILLLGYEIWASMLSCLCCTL